MRRARRRGGAHSLGLSAARGAGAGRRLDSGAGRQRRLSGRRRGRDKTLAMTARVEPKSRRARSARRDPPRRAAGAIPRSGLGRGGARALRARTSICRRWPASASRSPTRSAACSRMTWPRRSTCRRSTAPMWTASRCAPPTPTGASDSAPRRLRLNARGDRLRPCAGARGRARHRHHDRDRRRDAARRRRGGDDRAHRADRDAACAGDRAAPRRRARPVRLLCRLRHRARRDRAAARHAHRLARDRHAGGLRHRRGRRRCAGRRVAVLSTGDELVRAGRRAAAGRRSTTATARSWPRRSRKPAASRCRSALSRTTRSRSSWRCAARSQPATWCVLSGGTSKGAGDLSHRIVSQLGEPGMLVHGVALKPGKPLCLAVIDGKPIAVLPGFPTSAIFTFHAFVAPVIRARAGLPPEAARTVEADVPVRIASELGRKEFVLVVAGRRRGRPGRVSDRQGLGRGDELLAGRRLPGDRCAGDRARCRHAARA